MIRDEKINKILFGGDYNPEQWPVDILEEDIQLFKKAGVDVVTLNVFNWAMLQPSEEEYDFTRLDDEMDYLKANNIKVCLATSTAAHPAWMAKKYPEILRTEFDGMRRKFGGRHNSCPNSLVYKKYAVRLAKKLAERYKDYDNIVAWHISNEFGGKCYCETCEKAFRVWLQRRYQTLEALNKAWHTSFWGHTFYAWDEIVVPNLQSEHFEWERSMFQGISLDYARFSSDSMLECYKEEYEAIKEITPDIQITTNLMGFYKELDYHKWAKHMDFVSWDNYPSPDDPYYKMGMTHALMRGLKDGLPFALMEQTPSVTNWQPYNHLKRPGVMRLWSYQAVAHGSDTIMYFQMRRSIGACEKYHGALIDHVGTSETRVFKECAALGQELYKLEGEIIGSVVKSEVAILFDWDNWWALEYSAGPSRELRYINEIAKYYEALTKQNINVDIIGVDADLSPYKMVIAPVLYMIKGNNHESLEAFVQGGGELVTTFFSGIVDEHDLVTIGGYPGKLRKLLGIWVEEIDALSPGEANQLVMTDGRMYSAQLLCDLMHCETAKVMATYGKDFYAGMPALTVNEFGKGKAWYVGSSCAPDFYMDFFKERLAALGVQPIIGHLPEDIEVTRRCKEGVVYTFLLNHSEHTMEIVLDQAYTNLLTGLYYEKDEVTQLEAKDILILKHLCENK